MCRLRYVNFMKCIDEHGINLYCLSEKCQSQFEASYGKLEMAWTIYIT